MTNKNNKLKYTEFEFICKMLSKVFMLPICFLDSTNSILFESFEKKLNNPLFLNKNYLINIISNNNVYNFPVLKINNFYETFFYISVKNNKDLIGTFLVGPALSSNITIKTIDNLIDKFNLSIKLKKDLLSYYNELPILSTNTLLNFSLALYYSIYHKKIDINLIKEKNRHIEIDYSEINNLVDLSLSENRKNNVFPIPYEYEKLLFNYVKEGEENKLLNLLYNPPNGEMGVLSKESPLRHLKNQFIYACTLSYKASIDGGVNPTIAYSLSIEYIQRMETLDNIQEVQDLRLKMFLDFTNKAFLAKNKKKYSKYVVKSQNFIFNNLYEDISLSTLSKVVNLNPNYLSELFKKEVGVTLSNYIQQQKIEEAKKLLTLTDYSLSEIYTLLNFKSQSYFSTIFKKFTKVTATQYRNSNKTT
ncbi:MAG: helix-turn-helix domain-containing protein [Sarcina sp.]